MSSPFAYGALTGLPLSRSSRMPLNSLHFAGGPSSSSPSSTSPSTAAMQATTAAPTVVMPSDWSVPEYLKHSIFYHRFSVSSCSPVSSSSAAPGGPSATSSSQRLMEDHWGTSIASTSAQVGAGLPVSSSEANAPASSTVSTSAQQLYKARLENSHAQIPLPSKLDPKQCCKRLLIQDGLLQFCPEKDDKGRDKLNHHDPDKDAAAVRADHPIPPQAGIYYFEVEIVSKGQKGYIGIGFAARSVDLERLPGWNPESYGYHGDDGKAFACSGTGQSYSERFGSSDIIGCGIDFVAKRAFFVKNGKWLGYIFDLSSSLSEREDPMTRAGNAAGGGLSRRDRERGRLKETPGTAPLQFYPTIGLQTPGETVKVNFGQEPFKFDIDSFIRRRQREVTASVLLHPIPLSYKRTLAPSFPPVPLASSSTKAATSAASDNLAKDVDDPQVKACLQNLVASYLNYRGYSDTSRSFRKQRDEERIQWREVVSQSSSIFAATPGSADAASAEATGSSTPVKKKGKRKSEGGSKQLLKSALRTTLATVEQNDDTPMDAEGSGALSMKGEEDEEMESNIDRTQSSATVRDDFMTSDAKAKALDDLDADEAQLEDSLRRQRICASLRRGNTDSAMREIEDHYPGVVHPSSKESFETMLNGGKVSADEQKKRKRADLLFKLRCRKFIELVLASSTAGESPAQQEQDANMEAEQEDDEDEQVASQLILNGDSNQAKGNKGKGTETPVIGEPAEPVTFEEVLAYGSQLNALYPATDPSTSPHVLSKLKLIFSLVAYANPADLSSHGNKEIYNLSRQEERDELAEQVNKAMLESKGQPGIPHLELIYRQAHAVRNVLGDVFGDGRAALLDNVVD